MWKFGEKKFYKLAHIFLSPIQLLDLPFLQVANKKLVLTSTWESRFNTIRVSN